MYVEDRQDMVWNHYLEEYKNVSFNNQINSVAYFWQSTAYKLHKNRKKKQVTLTGISFQKETGWVITVGVGKQGVSIWYSLVTRCFDLYFVVTQSQDVELFTLVELYELQKGKR